jgi:hypothetical protein
MPDQRLHDHPYQWCDQPEEWKLIHIRPKAPKYPAGIPVLQGKSELDTHKSKAHGDDLP